MGDVGSPGNLAPAEAPRSRGLDQLESGIDEVSPQSPVVRANLTARRRSLRLSRPSLARGPRGLAGGPGRSFGFRATGCGHERSIFDYVDIVNTAVIPGPVIALRIARDSCRSSARILGMFSL